MAEIEGVIDYIDQVKVFVESHIEYLEEILLEDNYLASRTEGVHICCSGLNRIIDQMKALPFQEFNDQDWNYIMTALSGLYEQLAIFQNLLEEAVDYDNKRPELTRQRKQALEVYQKTTEQQQQERALKLAETQLQAEQQRAKNIEDSILEQQLIQKNNQQKYTLDDLVDIFKTRLGEITPELLAGDKQKRFLDLYNHLKQVLLQAQHLSPEAESILTNMVLLKYMDHLEKECIRKLAELEQNPNLSPQNKKIMGATLQSELMKDKAEIRKALDLFRKG